MNYTGPYDPEVWNRVWAILAKYDPFLPYKPGLVNELTELVMEQRQS